MKRSANKPKKEADIHEAEVRNVDPNEEQGFVQVYENKPESYEGTCLRPLGLCELGGCCDTCWYRPDHPRHRES